jgi:hypothetical protein
MNRETRGIIGVSVAHKRAGNESPISDPKRIVSALFEESGEIAPVDFGRFGKRAGEIIARAARTRGKMERQERPHRRSH